MADPANSARPLGSMAVLSLALVTPPEMGPLPENPKMNPSRVQSKSQVQVAMFRACDLPELE